MFEKGDLLAVEGDDMIYSYIKNRLVLFERTWKKGFALCHIVSNTETLETDGRVIVKYGYLRTLEDKEIIQRNRCETCTLKNKQGHDLCIANLEGVHSACCGHGNEGYILFNNGVRIRGRFDFPNVRNRTK